MDECNTIDIARRPVNLFFIGYDVIIIVGGVVASWLVHSTLERAVQVLALARDIVFCSWARHSYSHSASLHPDV